MQKNSIFYQMVDRRRLFRAENQNISIQSKINSHQYTVSGSRGITYQVNLQLPSCTCPDWKKRKPTGGCKHILAVKIHRGDLDSLPSAKTTYDPQNQSKSRNIPDWDNLAQRTKESDNWTCQICGEQGGGFGSTELHAHHIIPKSKGGEDTLDNLITVCGSCHEDLHGYEIPSRGRYNSPVKKKSSPIPDSDNESYRSPANEGNARCKSCNNISERHSTMEGLCDDCLAMMAPDQRTDENYSLQPRSLEMNPSTEGNSAFVDASNTSSTTGSSLEPQSTSSEQKSNASSPTGSSSQQSEFIFYGLILFSMGGFLELSRVGIGVELTSQGEAFMNSITFGGVNIVLPLSVIYILIGLFLWVSSHN